MNIYKSEQSIANLILENKSVSFLSLAENSPDQIVKEEDILNAKAIGMNLGQKDLHYVKTILVSTGMNKNDDVFIPSELWAARKTPEDKPFNLDHDEHQIIGHITSNDVMDAEGNLVTEFADSLGKFHIVTNAVIYKHWDDPAYIERTNEILKSIAAGERFVSMEALFSDFDYLVVGEDGQQKVVARDDESSFLTKHLRIYGGTGVYNSQRIGRVLKNIMFIGKGLVKKPANPESVILSSNANNINEINNGDEIMSEKLVENLEKQLEASTEKLVKAEEKNGQYAAELNSVKAENEALKTSVNENKGKIAALETDLANKLNDLKVATDEVDAAKKNAEKLQKDHDEMKSKCEKLEADIAKVEAEKKTAARVAELVKLGKNEADAAALEKSLSALNDEQFAATVALIVPPKSTASDVDALENVEETAAADLAVSTPNENKVVADLSKMLLDNLNKINK